MLLIKNPSFNKFNNNKKISRCKNVVMEINYNNNNNLMNNNNWGMKKMLIFCN